MLLVCLLVGIGACSRNASTSLSASEQMEIKTLSGQLADPGREFATKTEAASLLLRRPTPEAVETLRGFLDDPSNPSAQIAIAAAIARGGAENTEFVEPLMAMLCGNAPAVRAEAAKALATYKDGNVTEKLIAIATGRHRDREVWLVAIGSLQRVLDKKTVDALIGLLDDPDVNIRVAAAESLGKLTSISTFGNDAEQWKAWWERNKDDSQWLVELADNLARANSRLEGENAQIRERLARVLMDLYAAATPARRDAMLMELLRDPLSDVRLVGLTLLDRKGAAEDVPAEFRMQARSMLNDNDARVRKSAAIAVANLGDGDATELLSRLQAEQVPAVRQALLKALGQTDEPAVIPAVLAEIDSKYDNVAAAAAAALGYIAARRPLSAGQQSLAAETLVRRYGRLANPPDSEGAAALRESLLTAMGAIADPKFQPALTEALENPSASARLAAIGGLVKLGRSDSAERIAPLMADQDRGVRQAAIRAIGAMNGEKYLQPLLQRTDTNAETDAGVRKQAWDVVMDIMGASDAETLRSVARNLADRPDARDQHIRILVMLVAALKDSGQSGLAISRAQRDLAGALVAAARAAEAVPHLADAYKALTEAKSPDAAGVWLEWIGAMLAADDPAAVKAIAGQQEEAPFKKAATGLMEHLEAQHAEKKWAAVVAMAQDAAQLVAPRLDAKGQAQIRKLLATAKIELRRDDTQRVATLVAQLTAADEPTRKAAAAELQALKNRAVEGLLNELDKSVAAETPKPATERAILAVLREIAPTLNGYALEASRADRLKVIATWRKSP